MGHDAGALVLNYKLTGSERLMTPYSKQTTKGSMVIFVYQIIICKASRHPLPSF